MAIWNINRSNGSKRQQTAGSLVEMVEPRILMAAEYGVSYIYSSYLNEKCLVAGNDGAYWVLNPKQNHVKLVASDGSSQVWDLPSDSGGQLRFVSDRAAVTADGGIWLAVANSGGWHMALLAGSGQFSTVTSAQEWSGNVSWSLAPDAAGGVWYTDNDSSLHHVAVDGSVTAVEIDDARLQSVAAAADGGLWLGGSLASDAAAGTIWHLGADGDVQVITQNLDSAVKSLVVGADERLRFAGEQYAGWLDAAGEAQQFAVPKSSLTDLSLAADGGLWLLNTATTRNRIVHISNAGVISRFSSPEGSVSSITTTGSGSLLHIASPGQGVSTVNLSDDLLGRTFRVIVDYGESWTQTLASFVDPHGNTDPAAYVVTIRWADGVETSGSVVANDGGGFDIIDGRALPFGDHAVTITVSDANSQTPRSLSLTNSIYVVPPALAGKACDVSATSGREFSGIVAQYSGVATDLLDRYSVTINWGDGTSSQGQLVMVDAKTVNVVGQHVYSKPGFFDFTVNLSETGVSSAPARFDGGLRITGTLYMPFGFSALSTAYGRASVAEGVILGDILKFEATGGVPFVDAIAHFRLGEGAEDVGQYRATLDLGEGQAAIDAVIQPDGQGGFDVMGPIVFLREGYRAITVTIYHVSDPTASVARETASIQVREHLEVSQWLAYKTVSGTEFSGIVGSFSSEGTGTFWDSQFTATIGWGDGTSSEGTITPAGDGTWNVSGSHTYAADTLDRTRHASIRIQETRTPRGEGLPQGSQQYESTGGFVVNVAAGMFEGFTLQPSNVYSFVTEGDDDVPLQVGTIGLGSDQMSLEGFSGSVVWSDGVTSGVTFSRSGRSVQVMTQRVFSAAGSYTGTLTVSGAGDTEEISVNRWVSVYRNEQPLASVRNDPVEAVKGVLWSGIVGRFRPSDASADGLNFDVNIGWGDGTYSVGQIEKAADGWYQVRGSHTYTRAIRDGSTHLTITSGERIAHSDYSGNLDVTIDPTRINADGKWLTFRQREKFTSVVATFTAPLAGATPDDFEAWIDWGDGQRTRGVITARYDGRFDVTGTVTYQRSGYVRFTVTISGPGGSDVAESNVYLERNPIILDPASILTVNGMHASGQLGTFTDEDGPSTDPDTLRIYHAALVDWGDGEISWGLIQQRDDGSYSVMGDHEYQRAGDYQLNLIVRQTRRQLPSDRTSSGRFGGFDAFGVRATMLADSASTSDDSMEFGLKLGTLHISAANESAAQVVGTAGDDTITVTQTGNDILVEGVNGGSLHLSADQITSLLIRAGKGNDRVVIDPSVTVACILRGGAGNDTLIGGDGSETLYGGLGDDSISGGAGNDFLFGGPNADALLGQGGDDVLSGNRGRDTLRSGLGNDTLKGGRGADWLYSRNESRTVVLGGEGEDHASADQPDDLLSDVETILA